MNFNRSQTAPSPAQLLRLRHLLAVADGQLSAEAARPPAFEHRTGPGPESSARLGMLILTLLNGSRA